MSICFVLFIYSFFSSAEVGLQNHKAEVSFDPVYVSNKNDGHHVRPHETQESSHTHNSLQHHYTLMSVADFQRAFCGAVEKEVLSNLNLFAFENFRTYVRSLSGYNEHVLALEAKIKNDKHFKKKTAYIPGFEYYFGLRGESSGFHDFVVQEAQAIRTQQNKKSQQGTLRVDDVQKLDKLEQQWMSRKKFACNPIRLNDRLNSLHAVRVTRSKELDRQLERELFESCNTIKQLENSFARNHHVQALAPVVHFCAAQATKESCPIIAFGLSDFCHVVTKVLLHGMNVLYDATCAVGKGIYKSGQAFTSIEHWKDMATGMLQLGLLFADAVGQEEDFHYAAVLAKFSEESDVIVRFSEKYCLHTQVQKDLINRCAKETYQKIKSMSWQELLEGGTEIGTTMILDTLALHALSGFTKTTSNAFIKQLHSVVENEALFAGEYTVEVAGFGKLIVEEGAEVAVEAANIIKAHQGIIPNISKLDVPISTSKNVVKKGIIQNGGQELKAIIKNYERHIFSPDHKDKGILRLGKDQETIMDSLYNVITSLDEQELLKDGPNIIKTTINGIDNVEIRCFIQHGLAISVNAYLSKFNRIYGNFIDVSRNIL